MSFNVCLIQLKQSHKYNVNSTVVLYCTLAVIPAFIDRISIRTEAHVGTLCVQTLSFSADLNDA